jgi:hypothetical protein
VIDGLAALLFLVGSAFAFWGGIDLMMIRAAYTFGHTAPHKSFGEEASRRFRRAAPRLLLGVVLCLLAVILLGEPA